MVERGCQFLIATHSPILMALPGAQILVAQDAQLCRANGMRPSMCGSPARS